MAKVFALPLEEAALRELQTHTCFTEQGQYGVEVTNVIFVGFLKHDYIVQIHETHLPTYAREYDIEDSL